MNHPGLTCQRCGAHIGANKDGRLRPAVIRHWFANCRVLKLSNRDERIEHRMYCPACFRLIVVSNRAAWFRLAEAA